MRRIAFLVIHIIGVSMATASPQEEVVGTFYLLEFVAKHLVYWTLNGNVGARQHLTVSR